MYQAQNIQPPINIKFKTGVSPKNYPFVLAPINSKGDSGALNKYVFKELGIPLIHLPDTEALKNGFKLIIEDNIKILFIVTVDGNPVKETFKKNLRVALRFHIKDLNWPMWIPLMGTGVGGLSYGESFTILAKELERNKNLHNRAIELDISLPNDLNDKIWKNILQYTSQSNWLNLVNAPYTEINLQQEPFNEIIKEKEIYLVTALQLVNDLKSLHEKSKGKRAKAKSQNQKLPFEKIYELWEEQSRPPFDIFHDVLNVHHPNLLNYALKLALLISHFQEDLSSTVKGYSPERFISQSSISETQTQLFNFAFDWIVNEFDESLVEHRNPTFYRCVSYLEDPLSHTNIVIEKDREWIAENFLNSTYSLLTFEDELFKFFAFLNDKVANPANFYYLITSILYHRDYRYQWDEDMGVVGKSDQEQVQIIQEPDIPSIDDSFDKVQNIVENEVLTQSESETPELIKNSLQLATLNSDSAHKGQDLLGFKQDIEAFASIVALKDLTPPLAIALFGQWGTGKSFFMQKLSEKVDELAETQGFLREAEGEEATGSADSEPFCEGVCQIHFNAWSYMDTNLWASLVTQIFEGLDQYINQNSSEAEKEKEKIRKKIAKKLDVAKGQRALLAEKKIKARHSLKVLNLQVDEAKKSLNTKIKDIKTASQKRAIEEAIKKSEIKGSLEKILEEAGLDKEKLAAVNPDLILKELKSVQSFAHQFLQFTWKDWLWFIAGVGLFALPLVLTSTENTRFEGLESVGGILTVVIGALSKVRQTSAKLSPLINGVVKIKSDYDQAIAEAINQFEQEVLAMRIEADQLEAELQQVTEKLKDKEAEIESLNITTETVLARKAMYNFITNKAASTDYSRHLGIISMVRKDFQTLSHLFVESLAELEALRKKVAEGELTPQALEAAEKRIDALTKYEDFKNGFNKPLERIILYIDDLDRCPEERVVEVLEAVNLLMAFPLFVVVVGVDPRWVKNALIKKYYLQFTGHFTGEKDHANDMGVEVINASDYLEKIFQVPFHLMSPSDESIQGMIEHLVGDSIAEEKEETESVDSSETPPETEAMPSEESEAESDEEGSEETKVRGVKLDNDAVVSNDFEGSIDIAKIPGADDLPESSPPIPESEPVTPSKPGTSAPPALRRVTPESLQLHRAELEYMKDFSWLIGNTPRTVKRFVNMYRIIRAHEGLSYQDDDDKIDLLVVMFLLALRIGAYNEAFDKVIKTINIDVSGLNIGELIEVEFDYQRSLIEENLNEQGIEAVTERSRIKDKKMSEYYITKTGFVLNKIAFSNEFGRLRANKGSVFDSKIEFVKRFSFKSQ